MFNFPCFQLYFPSLKGHDYEGKNIRGEEKFHDIAFGLITKLLCSIEKLCNFLQRFCALTKCKTGERNNMRREEIMYFNSFAFFRNFLSYFLNSPMKLCRKSFANKCKISQGNPNNIHTNTKSLKHHFSSRLIFSSPCPP